MFDCGKTQIVKILEQKATILELWNSNEETQSQKRLNVEKYSAINGLWWEWYTRARASNIIAERIGDDTFKGTSGWLEKWKKRHDIVQEGDVNPETIDSWNERVKELTKGYSPRDVWNEDETGCLWKVMPEKSNIIAERIGDDTFKGTSGWLEKWKKRHDIVQEGDVNPETIDSWNERVKELTKGYSPRDVWNEDETGCLWKVMPEKSLSQKGKRCRGGKNAKQ